MRAMPNRVLLAAPMLFVLTGCATGGYTAVDPGVTAVGELRVTLGAGWKKVPDVAVPEKRPHARYLTRDSVDDDRLIVIPGLDDGDTLFRDDTAGGLPQFTVYMSADAVADAVAASLQAVLWNGTAHVQASNVREQGFTGIPGFRFDIEADVPAAPDHHGTGGGFVFDDRLYLVIFIAESPDSYGRYADAAAAVIDSAVVTIRTIYMP